MDQLVNRFVQKVKDQKADLSEGELSSLSAGLEDILESRETLIAILQSVVEEKNNEELQEALVELQIELVNHIKPHIESMEDPLMKVINGLG